MNKNNISDEFLVNLNLPENVYFLGLLWADGFVTKYGFDIYAVTDDFKSIEKYLSDMGITTIYERQAKKDGKNFGRVSKVGKICSIALRDFLIENDYDKKSFVAPKKILSKIPEHLKHYWWRGYFDGDGCLYVGTRNSLAFWSTIEQDWSCLLGLYKSLSIESVVNKYVRKGGKHKASSVEVRKADMILNVMGYLYKNYDEIGLKRKYEKYIKLVKKRKTMKVKTNKYEGVIYIKICNKWRSYIGRNKRNGISKNIMLGQYDSQEEAFKVRKDYLANNKINLSGPPKENSFISSNR